MAKLFKESAAQERADVARGIEGGTKGPPLGAGGDVSKSTHSPGHLRTTRTHVGKAPHNSMSTGGSPAPVPPKNSRGGY